MADVEAVCFEINGLFIGTATPARHKNSLRRFFGIVRVIASFINLHPQNSDTEVSEGSGPRTASLQTRNRLTETDVSPHAGLSAAHRSLRMLASAAHHCCRAHRCCTVPNARGRCGVSRHEHIARGLLRLSERQYGRKRSKRHKKTAYKGEHHALTGLCEHPGIRSCADGRAVDNGTMINRCLHTDSGIGCTSGADTGLSERRLCESGAHGW